MINKAILVGRLGKDPEVKDVGKGRVANFTLATDEKIKDQKKTTWHNISAWGKLADICEQHLKKGKLVYVEGRIQNREWEDQEGNRRRTTEIVIQELRMIGSDQGEDTQTRSKGKAADPVKGLVWEKMKAKRLGRAESEGLWTWAMERGYSPQQLLDNFEELFEMWKSCKTANQAPDDDDIPF